jgi:hypothetical protein
MNIYFIEAHRAHQTNIPAYWRADHDDGRYYTELECEVESHEAFAESAAKFFAAK